MRRLRGVLVGVLVAGALLVPASPAAATARSVIIHNSINSESILGIVNYVAPGRVAWVLHRGYTANNRAGAAGADTKGYYIGPGWCARLYVQTLGIGNPQWVFVGTTGPGFRYPLNQVNKVYGVETHPQNRGGIHGCG